MSGNPDRSRVPVRPFLIGREADGQYRLTVRETRYNGQGYPVVTTTRIEESFPTASAARKHAQAHFGAEPGQFASK